MIRAPGKNAPGQVLPISCIHFGETTKFSHMWCINVLSADESNRMTSPVTVRVSISPEDSTSLVSYCGIRLASDSNTAHAQKVVAITAASNSNAQFGLDV
jgi:hypothetical protein